MNEPIDVEIFPPPTPNRAPSPPIRHDPDGFTTMIEDVKNQIGKIQADFIRLQNQNMRLEETVAQSNRTINTINGELRAEKERVVRLTQRLAASEEANRLAQEQLKQVRVEMEKTAANNKQRQDETAATLQQVNVQVAAIAEEERNTRAVAVRSEETATQIAARSEGFFARNEARLNSLQQALSSAETLQTGTKQVPLYNDARLTEFYRKYVPGQPIHREVPDPLPANVLVGLKALGQSLNP